MPQNVKKSQNHCTLVLILRKCRVLPHRQNVPKLTLLVDSSKFLKCERRLMKSQLFASFRMVGMLKISSLQAVTDTIRGVHHGENCHAQFAFLYWKYEYIVARRQIPAYRSLVCSYAFHLNIITQPIGNLFTLEYR